jgi:threonylcarbamoyladenosine tRNA methylthiotransferase MtaB
MCDVGRSFFYVMIGYLLFGMDSKANRTRPSFCMVTLGCKVNQYESEAIAQELKDDGFVMLNSGPTRAKGPDTVIVNTCTVTQKAAMQSRQAIRQAIRSNPDATIIVTGCHVQTEPQDIQQIKGVHGIIGHADKQLIPDMVVSSTITKPDPLIRIDSDIRKARDFQAGHHIPVGNRTRPFVKIQDGCDAFCTYCIVPYARGPHRSMPLEHVLAHVKKIREAGYREIVLTGIHLGRYGSDLRPGTTLCNLVERLHHQETIDRIRLSSIEPLEITDDLLDLVRIAHRRPGHVCRHLHIPMQSGDNDILKAMRRPYSRHDFRELVQKIQAKIPDAAIGVDVMLGFPAETEAAFQNTYDLIEEMPLTYLHIFPFSPRKGTPASTYPDQIDPQTIKDRCGMVRDLGYRKRRAFLEQHIQADVEVIVETAEDSRTGLLKGISSNYIQVLFEGKKDLKNTFQKVHILKLQDNQSVLGHIMQDSSPI